MNTKILICEDEKNIVTFLKAELERAGYETDIAYDGEEAIRLFGEREYHLVLLDLMLPLKNGLEVLQVLRRRSSVPVIILTARKDTFDKVLLLKSGADDYITKPFDTLELLARIERNVERSRPAHTRQVLSIRDLKIEPEGFTCFICVKALHLTKTEFEILFTLCQNADKVLSRDMIMQKIYGDYLGDSNAVDVNIKNIRRKIAKFTEDIYIETVRGKGYVVRS